MGNSFEPLVDSHFNQPICCLSLSINSQSRCEDALEILQEILHHDSSLRVWFDRDISFEVGGELSADIVPLPRLVTSLSHEKLSDDSRLTSEGLPEISAILNESFGHELGTQEAFDHETKTLYSRTNYHCCEAA